MAFFLTFIATFMLTYSEGTLVVTLINPSSATGMIFTIILGAVVGGSTGYLLGKHLYKLLLKMGF